MLKKKREKAGHGYLFRLSVEMYRAARGRVAQIFAQIVVLSLSPSSYRLLFRGLSSFYLSSPLPPSYIHLHMIPLTLWIFLAMFPMRALFFIQFKFLFEEQAEGEMQALACVWVSALIHETLKQKVGCAHLLLNKNEQK